MDSSCQDPTTWTLALLKEFAASHGLKRSGKKESLAKARTSYPLFTVETIVSLFVDSVADDVKKRGDFKSFVGDSKAIRLFKAGYLLRIKLKRDGMNVFFTAQCQPEMKSCSDYKMRMIVRAQPSMGSEDSVVEKFLFTECSCPAGKGPHATCKHLSALLYALEEFNRLGYVRETITCTGRLQQWNKPRNKQEKVMKLSDMDWKRPSLSKQCFNA